MAISIRHIGDTYENTLTYIADAVATIGITTDEATEAMSKLAQLIRDMESANARIDWLEDRIGQLESVPDAKTENPNQKSDLEIFNRIVPSEEFLKLEGNMFLN
jgi:predicted ATP-binding protein involved in virulence